MNELKVKRTLDDLAQCPLCETDGQMEGKLINERTFIWVCNTCPGVLFEFHDNRHIEDVTEYLKRDVID